MRFKVPFLGYVLALVGLLLPSIVFVAVLPSLINAKPVQKRLIAELQSWTGFPIEIRGPISLESFFSLSVNVQNVEFKGFRGLPELKALHAGEIVARIAWTNLLSGRLDFDKIKISDATLFLRPAQEKEIGHTISALLIAPSRSAFTVFMLTDCKLEMEGAPPSDLYVNRVVVELRPSNQRINFEGAFKWRGEDVAVDFRTYASLPGKNAAPRPLRLKVASRLLNVGFKGDANLAAGSSWTASGEVNAGTPDAAALSRWIKVGLAPTISDAVAASGTVDAAGDHLNFQSTAFSLGSERANGDLMITTDAAGPHVEGSLAFDTVDLRKLWAISTEGSSGKPPQDQATTSLPAKASLDLRISANQMLWSGLTMDRSALTLTGRAGQYTAEIADLHVFGGSVLGHIAADLNGEEAQLRARLTADDIDASQLLTMVAGDSWFSGTGEANIELEAAGRTAAELLARAKANARISFPEGGQVRLSLPRIAQQTTFAGRAGWDGVGVDWSGFDDLRLSLAFEDGRLRCRDLRLTSPEASLSGNGEVDLDRKSVDWRLQVWPGASDEAFASGLKSNSLSKAGASLSIEGPWAAPAIQFGRQSGERTGRDGSDAERSAASSNL